MSDLLLKAFDTPANENIPDLGVGDDELAGGVGVRRGGTSRG